MTIWFVLVLAALCPGTVLSAASWSHHVLLYNFMDDMAQSVCTALAPMANRRIWAIRNHCKTTSTDCNKVCLKNKMRCFDGLFVFKEPTILAANPFPGVQPDAEKQGLSIQRFAKPRGCTFNGCGPNYCCCYRKASLNHNGAKG